MRFGLTITMSNPPRWRRDPAQVYRDMLELAAVAEDLGFDSVWVSENHFQEGGTSPSPLTLAAAIAARTRRVRLGTGVLLLPLHHPVKVAEDAAMVDALSNGRLLLGLGRGYRREEFLGYGLSRKDKGTLFNEALEVLVRCFTEESFSFCGAHYNLKGVAMTPRGVQRPHPPIYVGARSDAATRRMAGLEYPLILIGGKRQYDIYAEAVREHGRDPLSTKLVVFRGLFCTKDPQGAQALLEEPLRYRMEQFRRWASQVPQGQADNAVRQLLIGDPDTCGRAIEEMKVAIPSMDILAWGASFPGVPNTEVIPALELFAREVMPRFA